MIGYNTIISWLWDMYEIARRLWVGLFSGFIALLVIDVQVMLYYTGPFRLGILIILVALAVVCFMAGLFILFLDVAFTLRKEHPELMERKAKKQQNGVRR
ncbi:MAG: hypothetical protein ABSF74_06910 [Dehalococcoidia bacterium]|jgi:membrane protein YdbS with pleckstrin-like domain